jgi:hypothetical protein
MWELVFWKDALERAVKSAAQAGLLALGGGAADVLTLDWLTFCGAVGGGALLSLLTSLGSSAVGVKGTASVTKAVEPAE